MKYLAALFFASTTALAITPPPQTAPKPCAKYMLAWTAPTTRVNGAALSASELASYSIWATPEKAEIVVAPNLTSYLYTLPEGYTTTSSDAVAMTAKDKDGNVSPMSPVVALGGGATCPKSPPAAPANLSVTAVSQ